MVGPYLHAFIQRQMDREHAGDCGLGIVIVDPARPNLRVRIHGYSTQEDENSGYYAAIFTVLAWLQKCQESPWKSTWSDDINKFQVHVCVYLDNPLLAKHLADRTGTAKSEYLNRMRSVVASQEEGLEQVTYVYAARPANQLYRDAAALAEKGLQAKTCDYTIDK
jgi:hypothetical protein